MIVSSNERMVLKAVEELQDKEKMENVIVTLEKFFDVMVVSEEFGDYTPAYRKELIGNYRNLRNFLSELPVP